MQDSKAAIKYTSYVKTLCPKKKEKKMDLAESLIYLESQICSSFFFTITYWKPGTSQLVHTLWNHEPLNGCIFVTL